MQNRPTYAIASVDNALRLALLLQQEGPLHLTEAAERLGVARSTAHRLLSMLVFRGFAEQAKDRRYVCGSVLRLMESSRMSPGVIRAAAMPHMQTLMMRTGETANLMTLAGGQVRFLATVESTSILRVGDREGRLLPAWLTSGGKAILAAMSDAEVRRRLEAEERWNGDLPTVLRAIRTTRKRGFAINDQLTERGVTAIGVLIGEPAADCAVSIAMPTTRYSKTMLPELVVQLRQSSAAIQSALGNVTR